MPYRGYESRCKTCNSQHRDEIEEKRLEENMSYSKISEWLEEEHHESITKQSLSNHFKKHVMEGIEQARKSEMKQREIAKNEVDETLNLIDELRGSIKILKNMLNNMMQKSDDFGSKEMNSITKCLSEIRKTIKELNSLTGSLEIGDIREENKKEQFFDKVVSRLDSSVAQEVLKAWDEAEEEEGESIGTSEE